MLEGVLCSTRVLRDATITREAVLKLFDWAESIYFAYAWISIDGSGSPWDVFPTKKLKRGVLGLQFAGTHPDVLEHLHETARDRVQVMAETKGTFHPKVLVGTVGRVGRAIVGSSNFTAAAFRSNYEVNIELSGARGRAPIADLLAVIDGYFFSPKSRELDIRLLRKYRSAWKRRPKPPRLGLPRRSNVGRWEVNSESIEHVGWSEYLDLLLE